MYLRDLQAMAQKIQQVRPTMALDLVLNDQMELGLQVREYDRDIYEGGNNISKAVLKDSLYLAPERMLAWMHGVLREDV